MWPRRIGALASGESSLFTALRSSVQNCEVKTRIHKCIADSEKQIKDIEKVVLTDLSFRHIYVYVH